jgi:hypothetical protein
MAVANPETPAATPEVPAAPASVSQAEHNAVLIDNAILRARAQFPRVPEDLLRKYKGEKPEDYIAFAEFADKSFPAQASPPPAPAPAPPVAAVPPSGGEPVPAPGVGSTVSPQAVADMRRKELRDKVIHKRATQEESYELADMALISAFNTHMKKTRVK